MNIRLALVALVLMAAPALPRVAAAQDDVPDEAAAPDPLAEDEPQAEVPEADAPTPPEPEPDPEPAQAESPPPAEPPAPSQPAFTAKGFLKLQMGVFMPLLSDSFRPHSNEAFIFSGSGARRMRTSQTCDPVVTPNIPCYALDHGQDPGSLSIARATLQFDGLWTPSDVVGIRGVIRGVRSLELEADEWAQIPVLSEDPSQRRRLAREYVHQNFYNELDLRQLYIEARPSDALSFRVGRQLWIGAGQYRLLDVVNPVNDTWHFGPLESFEDTRVPLWMATATIGFTSINHSLELIWVPLLDRPRDTVTVPLSLAGAWGIPYSNTPSPYVVGRKVFDYPGGRIEDMRGGVHWKGNLGERANYSLLYYYTHQLAPPIPTTFDERLLDPASGLYDSTYLERLVLEFPRQHLAGFSLGYAFEAPIATPTKPFGVPGGLVATLEGLVEANRTYPVRTDADSISGGRRPDPTVPGRWHFAPEEKLVTSYALQLTRPTMIPALNAELPFLFVGQFIHTIVPGLDEQQDALLTEIPGYNEYEILKHQMRFVVAVATVYLRGFLVPKLVGAFVYPDSGFYSLDLGINLSAKFGFHLTATDFIGTDPYARLGLFRDRDELAFSMQAAF